MAQNPLVSIVTPSYNQAAYLEQTIQSVLKQGYEPIEFIIIDGASTDGSLDIIQRYSDRLAWWVSESDAGQAEAINKGLKGARGEIVAWLNSDDLYLPGSVARAVTALQRKSELGMVFGDALTIDAKGRPLNKLTFGNWGLPELIRFRIICQPAVFMKYAAVEKAGFLDPSFHCMLDHHLWIRIARLFPIQRLEDEILDPQNPGKITRGMNRQIFSPIAAARHHSTAKNVAQATEFGRETLRILAWMQEQPDLASMLVKNQKRVRAGAYRLNARYLLNGDMPWPALLSYARSVTAWPGFALKHWHRMIYAVLCLLRIDGFTHPFRRLVSNRQTKRLIDELRGYRLPVVDKYADTEDDKVILENWPGLNLEG